MAVRTQRNGERVDMAFVSPAGYGRVNPTLSLVAELVGRGHRVTYATGRSLVPAIEQTGATTLRVLTGLPDEDWQPPETAGRVLFVSLGTLFNDRPELFRTCAEAFAGTGWHVEMAVGSRVTAEDLGPLPPSVRAGAYLPQSAFLRDTAVFVSHAGMNTTVDSLYFGVPMVTLLDTPEQRVNAARVEELGLVRQLPGPDVSAEHVRKVVEAVADDASVWEGTAAMRERIRECGGATAGAEAIERHLAGSA
jgi:MGT family glycosyltransferase